MDKSMNKGFMGQPKGLQTLFFTEMWERFSYYGMRAILIFYIYYQVSDGGLGLSKTSATQIMSIYGALVYMSGIVGGWVSDRLLGPRKTVFYGGIAIMVGHIILSLPLGAMALFISMAFIIAGTGMLKPNVSNLVGHLYSEEDIRRDTGFSIFYMGINIGSFLAPIIVGMLQREYNFHVGFSVAAIGMAAGLIQYYIQGKKTIGEVGLTPTNPIGDAEKAKVYRSAGIATAILVVIVLIAQFTGHLSIAFVVNLTSIIGIGLPIYYFTKMLTSKEVSAQERVHVRAYIPLFLAAVAFWSVEEQGSSILARFAEDNTNRSFMGFSVAASMFQSLNPVFVILFTPLFAVIWSKLGKRQPSTVMKFVIALFLTGSSFLLLVLPGVLFGSGVKFSPWWLIGSFALVILGEMCLSPVGLSATTKLAPKAFQSQTMAIWFLSDAASQAINAQIAPFYTNHESLYFGIVGGVTVIIGFILLGFAPKVKKLMEGLN